MVRIAVVDADPDFLHFMRDALGEHSWDTILCSDLLSAYAALRAEVPDVIILDVWLDTPYTGWDLLTFLHLHPQLHAVPAIVCTTATGQVRDRADWLDAHDVAVLAKPFDLDDLYAMIEQALADRRPAHTFSGMPASA